MANDHSFTNRCLMCGIECGEEDFCCDSCEQEYTEDDGEEYEDEE